MCRSTAAGGSRCRTASHRRYDPAARAALRAYDAARQAHHRARARLAAVLRDGPAGPDVVSPLRAALLDAADRLTVARAALPPPRTTDPPTVTRRPPPPTFLAPTPSPPAHAEVTT